MRRWPKKELENLGLELPEFVFGVSQTRIYAPRLWSDAYPTKVDLHPTKADKHPTKVAGHLTTPDAHPTKVEKHRTTSDACQIWLDAHPLPFANLHKHNGKHTMNKPRLFSAWPDPTMARLQNRAIWHYRLKGMVVGWAVAGSLSALIVGGQYYSYYRAVQTDKPRRFTFERECAHPVEGDSAKFNHASAGQSSCEVYTGTARFNFTSHQTTSRQRYWLNIGDQVVKDEVGSSDRDNPESLD